MFSLNNEQQKKTQKVENVLQPPLGFPGQRSEDSASSAFQGSRVHPVCLAVLVLGGALGRAFPAAAPRRRTRPRVSLSAAAAAGPFGAAEASICTQARGIINH